MNTDKIRLIIENAIDTLLLEIEDCKKAKALIQKSSIYVALSGSLVRYLDERIDFLLNDQIPYLQNKLKEECNA